MPADVDDELSVSTDVYSFKGYRYTVNNMAFRSLNYRGPFIAQSLEKSSRYLSPKNDLEDRLCNTKINYSY